MPSEARSLLRHAPYRRALAGQTVSAAGSWMQTVAAGWVVWQSTESAVAVAALTALAHVPGLAVSALPWSPVAVRVPAAALYALQAATVLLLALADWTGGVEAWQVYVAAAVVGNAAALAAPALRRTVERAVPGELAGPAAELGALSHNLARLGGSVAGGLLFAAAGAGACFAVNAASYVPVIVAVLGVPVATLAPAGPRLMRRASARPGLLAAIAVSALVGPVQELASALVPRFGDDALTLGLALGSLGAGGLAGALVRQRLTAAGERQAAAAVVLGGVALVVLAAASSLPPALAAFAAAGAAWEVVHGAAREHTGREGAEALALATLVALLAGTLAAGVLFDAVGEGAGVVSYGIAATLLGVWLAARPLRPARGTPARRR